MSSAAGVASPPASVGVYVHFPWCVKKCPYCDFNSHPLRGSLDEVAYLDALIDDFAASAPMQTIDSVYCGGGTPSLFSPASFARLLRHLDAADDAEVTMEANPGTLEHSDFGAYREAGINRISLGAQSFDPSMLTTLGRIHSPDETDDAAGRIRAAGISNFNVDLMYGLPNQTAERAIDDLERAFRLNSTHLSWYQLTIEPKTEFARRIPTGLPDESRVADIEGEGLDRLAREGFVRYEVSAFARPGFESRHNINYWSFGDYVGIGAGAHGKLTTAEGIVRTTRASQPRIYLRDSSESRRRIDAEEISVEFMMNALRLVEGVEWQEFPDRTGLPLEAVRGRCEELIDWGLMRRDRLALTPAGLRQLDAVVARFL